MGRFFLASCSRYIRDSSYKSPREDPSNHRDTKNNTRSTIIPIEPASKRRWDVDFNDHMHSAPLLVHIPDSARELVVDV